MRRWVGHVIYAALAVEIVLVAAFAAMYKALDFNVYMWGGRAVIHDTHLYLAQADGHWFTYPPFAAMLFTPRSVMPAAVARVAWDLASVAAFAFSCVIALRLARPGGLEGYRPSWGSQPRAHRWRGPSRSAIAAVTAGGLTLEPVYHTLFLGQINLFLLALVLFDVWRLSGGRHAGIVTGFAAAIKLTPAIFIVLLLITKRTRSALTATGTFVFCGLTAYVVAQGASRLYWSRLFYDTKRVGAPYISNQSPYGAALRIFGGTAHLGAWYALLPLAIGAAGITVAATLGRHHDWLGAAAVTGVTGLSLPATPRGRRAAIRGGYRAPPSHPYTSVTK